MSESSTTPAIPFQYPTGRRQWWTVDEYDRLKRLCSERGNPEFRWNAKFARTLMPEFPGRTFSSVESAIERLRQTRVGGKKRLQSSEPALVLTQAEAAYIAAMIEGEGSVLFKRGKARHGCQLILITNTDYALIDYIHKLVPFARVEVSRQRPRWKTLWKVMSTHRLHTLAVLRWIIPYMRGAKRVEAEHAFRFINGRDSR